MLLVHNELNGKIVLISSPLSVLSRFGRIQESAFDVPSVYIRN